MVKEMAEATGQISTSGHKKSPKSSPRKHPPRTAPTKSKSNTSPRSSRRPITAPDPQQQEKYRVLDFSGQGLTTLPANIYQHREFVRELQLFSNNLRALPPDLRRFKYLEKLDVRGNGIKCTSNEDSSGFPLELGHFQYLKRLNLSECNLRYIPPAVWKITSLEHLDISKNRIRELPAAVGNLFNVTYLNLQQMELTTLPNDIVYCEQLEDLYLWGNNINQLPDSMTELQNLKCLAMNFTFFTEAVSHDPMIVTLLKKGQIKSEHIPSILLEIPNLKTLDFEKCLMNNLPDAMQKNAEEIYLSGNFFYTLPECINEMLQLTILDLTQNFLTELPTELLLPELRSLRLSKNNFDNFPICTTKLPRLESLYLDFNKIRNLPNEICKMKDLKLLNLEGNAISRLPESICTMTNLITLDLSRNKLKALPINIHQLVNITDAHTFKKFEHSGLWLFQNPLILPPEEIWKAESTTKIYNYMKKLQISKTENLVRQKIIVIGEKNCGKTSFIRSLVLGKSAMTEPGDNTVLMGETRWKTNNEIDFIILEIAGDEIYNCARAIFLDPKAIFVVLFDQSTLTEEKFHEKIGRYIDLLHRYVPGAVVKIIATKTDSDNDDDVATTTKSGTRGGSEGGVSRAGSLKKRQNSMSPRRRRSASPRRQTSVSPRRRSSASQGRKRSISPGRRRSSKLDTLLPCPSSDNEQTEPDTQSLKDNFLQPELETIQPEIELLQPEVVRSMIAKQQSDHKLKLEELFQKLKKLNDPTEERRFVMRRVATLVSSPLRIMPFVATVHSSDGTTGMNDLISEFEAIVVDKDLTPFSQRYVPGHWIPFRAKLNKFPGYSMTMSQVKKLGNECKILNEADLLKCLNHLHDTGDIIWLHSTPNLREVVFQNPMDLVAAIRSLYRHDIQEYMNFKHNLVFISVGRFDLEEDFEEARTDFFQQGYATILLLRCLWFYLGLDRQKFDNLNEVLPKLGLLYTIPTPDIPTPTSHKLPSVCLPWYIASEHDDVTEIWPEIVPDNMLELRCTYKFPVLEQENVFEKFSIEIQSVVWTRFDWKNLIYATNDEEMILVERLPETLILSIRGCRSDECNYLFEQLVELMGNILRSSAGLVWESRIARETSSGI